MSRSPVPPPLAPFSPPTRDWFAETFAAATDAQARGWVAIAAGRDTLILAPTGSGKTLAAFLWCLDQLSTAPAVRRSGAPGPLRLAAQGAGVRRRAQPPCAAGRDRRVAERAGVDRPGGRGSRSAPATRRPTSARASRKHPPDILITTPESLYLLLTSQAREILRGVEHVIVDEIHALAGTKRGAHLALSLERLERWSPARRHASASATQRPLERIGLSATQRPLERDRAFLGGAGAAVDDRRRRDAEGARARGDRAGRRHGRARARRSTSTRRRARPAAGARGAAQHLAARSIRGCSS